MIETNTLSIELNGREHAVPEATTVAALLDRLGIQAETAAVEVNQALVPRAARKLRVLAAGDRVEVVTMVGGG